MSNRTFVASLLLLIGFTGCPTPEPTMRDADVASDAYVTDATDDAGTDASRSDGGPDAGPPMGFEEEIDYWMNSGGLHGVAALARQGTTRVVAVRGLATETMPVDEHTLFNVASISKTFVGALALQEAEAGRLDLDGDVAPILGFALRHPMHASTAITPRMLMAHTSGLIDDFLDLSISEGDPTETLDAFARTYAADPTHWGDAPGTTRSYCNACLAVLARVVERTSSSDFRVASRTRLFEPLGLDGAGWFFADIDASRLAHFYTWAPRIGYAETPMNGYAHYPAGMLMISLSGLERWTRGHVEMGTLDGTRFLAESSITETRRAQFPAVSGGQAMVWYYTTHAGSRWLSHSGSSFGASSQLLYRPEDGRMIIVLTNSDAYIRSRFGQPLGGDAIERIIERMNAELERSL